MSVIRLPRRGVSVQYKCGCYAIVISGKDEAETTEKENYARNRLCPRCKMAVDKHNAKAIAAGRPPLKY